MERQPFEFRGYTSINNVDDNSQVTKMNEENFFNSDVEWIFTEKVHGSNFQFTTDGERIQCSKRTSILQPGESFFNWESTRDKEQGKILNLFKSIQEYFNDYSINEIIVFGELFGGTYLHPDVPKIENVKHIQKGIYYSPNIHFYVFDIWVKNHSFLNYDDFEKLCSKNDLLYSKAIMRGKYSDLVKFDIENFQTLIPNHFNLPPIPNNISEGIVLKPVINKFTCKGNRVILKYKSEKFREVVGIKKVKDKKFVEIVPQSDIVSYHKTNIEQYVNDNRLHSVLSKWGDVVTTKDEGKLTGLLSKDALKTEWNALNDKDKKTISSYLPTVCRNLVKKHMQDIIDGNF